jgi:hypothetical protein
VLADKSFPKHDTIVRRVGAWFPEQNDACAVQRARDMTLETSAPMGNDPLINLPAMAS